MCLILKWWLLFWYLSPLVNDQSQIYSILEKCHVNYLTLLFIGQISNSRLTSYVVSFLNSEKGYYLHLPLSPTPFYWDSSSSLTLSHTYTCTQKPTPTGRVGVSCRTGSVGPTRLCFPDVGLRESVPSVDPSRTAYRHGREPTPHGPGEGHVGVRVCSLPTDTFLRGGGSE